MASHVQMVRAQGTGDQTQNQYILPNAPWDTQFDFWLNPFSFLEGAMANSATVRVKTVGGTKYSVVTFTLQNKYKVAGYINDRNMVEKVQTWIDNDVLGDMLAEASYSVYKDFGGVQFPTMIIEKQGGFPVLIVSVSSVKPNAAVDIQPPQTPADAASQGVSVQSEKIADGVFYLKGGTHHSVAVEFADHSVVIEGPQNEPRSLAVIAEVKRLIPNKPIKYLINTHHHWDHSSGIRTYVAEGATVITSEMNKAYYERDWKAPRTLDPDMLAKSPKKANFITVKDSYSLTDGGRTLELHLTQGDMHNAGILFGYMPKEKILIEAYDFTPPNPGASLIPTTMNFGNILWDNVQRLKLDVQTIAPLHGRVVPYAEFPKALGKG
jgi:Zn-dependent hydrolases, including glyoxylases